MGLAGSLRLVDNTPPKPFRRAFYEIRPGMIESEVDALFFAQLGRIPNKRRSPRTLSYCLDPINGRYNAEIILINFADGRVTGAEYHPD
jgi:hypothetical protein